MSFVLSRRFRPWLLLPTGALALLPAAAFALVPSPAALSRTPPLWAVAAPCLPPGPPAARASLARRLGDVRGVIEYLRSKSYPGITKEALEADPQMQQYDRALQDAEQALRGQGTLNEAYRRAQASLDADDLLGAEATLNCLGAAIGPLIERIQLLLELRTERDRGRFAGRNLRFFVAANAQVLPNAAAIAQAEEGISRRIAGGDFTHALIDEQKVLATLYAEARKQAEVAAVVQAKRAAPVGTVAQARATPCPPLRLPEAGRPAAHLDAERSEPSDLYYPPAARSQGFDGVTTIRAEVAASGCVLRAQVMVHAGDARLDAAALLWVLRGAVFVPAQKDGRAVDSTTWFNVRFRLED
jgi:TonB family protein